MEAERFAAMRSMQFYATYSSRLVPTSSETSAIVMLSVVMVSEVDLWIVQKADTEDWASEK